MIFNPRIQKSVGPVGTRISTLEVGTLVKMNLNGTPWEWRIVHQGLPGDMYDASCDGCWLLLENIHSERRWDSTNNDYKNSDINIWLQSDFLPMLDSGTQGQVKQVKIPYVNGTGGSPVASGANGLSCKIFLLSGYELGWTTSNSSYYPRDGAKLSYFSSGTSSAANNKRIANYNGSATDWWLRSPYTRGSDSIWSSRSDGDGINLWYGSAYGIRPALILPSTALVDDELNVLTGATPEPEPQGTALSDLAEGTIIKIKENGSPVEFYLAKHNYEEGLNGAGRELFVRKDCYDKRQWDFSNTNSWTSSDIYSWLNSSYKDMFSDAVKAMIGNTKYYYTPGNGNNILSTRADSFFLMSYTELGYSFVFANVEGNVLPTASILQVSYFNGAAAEQWTRSPHTNANNAVWVSLSNGGGSNASASDVRGSRPCFTLPSTAKVDNDLNLLEVA